MRTMQRRLSQIAQIPLIIQSTLDAVARSFDDFLPPEEVVAEAPLTLIDLSAFVEATSPKGDDQLSVNNDDNNAEDIDSPEAIVAEESEEPIPVPEELEPEPEVQVEPEPTEEEIQRMEKLEKVNFVIKLKNIFNQQFVV